ncbi:MAG: OB-fold protein [Flavitalea sp.]
MISRKNIFLAVLLIILAGAIYIYKEYNRTNTNVAEEISAFTVEANELIKAFSDDDSAANMKYVGKVISVRGFVKNVNQDEKGYYSVSLGDTASLSSVRCSVDSMYSGRAASLKPGTTITVKGSCTGYIKDELLGLDVIINRCFIQD